ncbi:alpha/beta fold hydrolase [Nonomuraea sp. NPDC050540]|uniref:alpha/beta fold hydrolase n=1 Tax=Nonomuraea sp. NPDC050540 TaxID=3364367 RepID=UPI0037B1BAB4
MISALMAITTALSVLSPSSSAQSAPAWCPTVAGHRVECGTESRPLVAGKPALGTIDVAYALIRRKDESKPARNTIVVNPGGPGGGAIESTKGYTKLTRSLAADHDLLLIDPRGTGQSGKLTCGLTGLALLTRPELRRAAARCAATLGPRAEGYTSAATADDIDAVRRRLGLDQIVLYGVSYGTYLMSIYAERHPETVRSVLFSGAYPVGFDPLGGPSARAVSLTLRRICERAAACDGDAVVADLRTVNARLRAEPRPMTVTVDGNPRALTLTESMLALVLTFPASDAVGSTPGKASLLGRMPARLHHAARGDFRPLVKEIGGVFKELAADQDDQALSTSVVCNDYARPWSVHAPLRERWRQFHRSVESARPAEFGTFSPRAFATSPLDGGDLCIAWPAKGTARPYTLTGKLPDVPTLVISGDLDSNTSDENGRRNAAQFPRARFLPVPNTGHIPELDATGCAKAIVTGFIRHERLGDTSCLRRIPPIKVKLVR